MIIKVAIVEDTDDIRKGLAELINSDSDFECVETYRNGQDALEHLPALKPDVVLMDINMPGMSGIECVRKLKPLMPATQFVMSTIYEDDDSIFESLKAGATGYLLKKTKPERILEAIHEVYNGGSPMSWQIARRVIGTFHENTIRGDELTEREQEILNELSKGLRYKEIAGKLFISTETVRTHVRKIYEKLQVHSRTDALNKIQKR